MEHLIIDIAKIAFVIVGAAIFTAGIISFGTTSPDYQIYDEYGPYRIDDDEDDDL
jgi:hypothetical protein